MINESVKEKIRKRLGNILDIDPELKEILMSGDSVEEKRRRIRSALYTRGLGIHQRVDARLCDDQWHIQSVRDQVLAVDLAVA